MPDKFDPAELNAEFERMKTRHQAGTIDDLQASLEMIETQMKASNNVQSGLALAAEGAKADGHIWSAIALQGLATSLIDQQVILGHLVILTKWLTSRSDN